MEEGYIKYRAEWEQTPPFPNELVADLNEYRAKMYRFKLISVSPDGIGYGNISQRLNRSQAFLITGSATGAFPVLDGSHYSLVSAVDTAANLLHCWGPTIASSEAMSHAVIYKECPEVNAVIHIHHQGIWHTRQNILQTTPAEVAYGTPEMADAIVNLLRHSNLRQERLFITRGHQDGIFAFGESLRDAIAPIFIELHRWNMMHA